jgi:hypothetical protein
MITTEGLEPATFRCQDDGAGLLCRGSEKKSDVWPAELPANVSFFLLKRTIRDKFSSTGDRLLQRRYVRYSAAVEAGFGEPMLSASLP